MAKMIDRQLLKLFIMLDERLTAKTLFYTQYQIYLLDTWGAIKQAQLQFLEAEHDKAVCHQAYRMNVHCDNLDQEIGERQKAIEEKFKWKLKALKQTLRRKNDRNPDQSNEHQTWFKAQEAQLLALKRKRLDRVVPTFHHKNDASDVSQETLRAIEAKEAAILTAKKEKIEARYQRKIESLNLRTEKKRERLTRLNQKIKGWIETIYQRHPKNDYDLGDDIILRLENLTMRFGGLVAVDQLSFEVKQGEIFGLIGPNGAGKTTVFNCITKFYRPAGGKMIFRKSPVDVIVLNDYPVHRIVRQGIIRTFQNVELVWELSVIDNLLVAAHSRFHTGFFGQLLHIPKLRHEEAVLRQKAMHILEHLGLQAYMHAIPYGLPYGILKRIELARTLMVDPKLIILDEPAAGLNDQETRELARIIRDIRDRHDVTIFLVEHDMGLVMDICDRVCAISFGKKIAIGTPKEIQANKAVRDAYLGEE
ncbi:MAG: ATP-binding cassette domain-containing protein [Candidatus Izemoplasmatales bacterium]|nr:ATP-binding cassette domain-containing protein [Candidatus Izemoplasmatales bacterium]